MSFNAKVLNVLIASPSDVEVERNDVEMAIYDWNRRYSKQLNIVLLPRRWEKDVVPAYRGDNTQEIINEQIVNDSDVLVGIFWTKLGTPTLNHSSGTLEEINQFIEAGKSVLLYFLDKPVPRNNTNYPEMQRVDEFKKNYATRGIFSNEIHKVVDHLYQTVLQLKPSKHHLEDQVMIKNSTSDLLDEVINIERLIIDRVLTDNEILLLAFSLYTGTRKFGDRWLANETKQLLQTWITKYELNSSVLVEYYSEVIANLSERGILEPIEFTSHGNPRLYALSIKHHNKLRNLSHPATQTIERIIRENTLELPF